MLLRAVSALFTGYCFEFAPVGSSGMKPEHLGVQHDIWSGSLAMKMQDNTILITGGGSGIGRALAEAFHKLGNRVVIAGRREAVLAETAAANPGMEFEPMDTANPESIQAAAGRILQRFPELNVVINNAGVQRFHDFAKTGLDEAAAKEEIETNIWGVMRVIDAFVPHLKTVRDASIVNVSSGLAFIPLAPFPVYCATKAFVHSFSVSLRHQLRDVGIRVVELAPPWVATDLGAKHPPEVMPEPISGTAPGPMPLDAFIAAAMEELASDKDELPVAQSKFLHASGVGERAAATFAMINH
jgi:uncharacterized oxidoreductase